MEEEGWQRQLGRKEYERELAGEDVEEGFHSEGWSLHQRGVERFSETWLT